MKKYDIIIENGATICYNRKASTLSTAKLGGQIDTLIIPNSEDCLAIALDNTEDSRIVLGNMSNVLLSDSGVREEVVLTTNVLGISVKGNVIRACCGESLTSVAQIAKRHSLSGLENLFGIPGTVGGALSMNAGAFGSCMADIVQSATVWDNGCVREMRVDEMCLGYRDSIFLHSKAIVLAVTFSLRSDNSVMISRRMKETRRRRATTQPEGFSLGSVFKRHDDISAGYYIEKCGLKGYRIGDVMISDIHANMIVNVGKGRATDYMALMDIMKNSVKEKYGIELSGEVRLIGEFERKIQDNS